MSESITTNGKPDKDPFFQIILNISSNNDRCDLLMMMCSSNAKATKNKLKDLICSISYFFYKKYIATYKYNKGVLSFAI